MTETPLARLDAILSSISGSVLIAFSGGVDSSVLLACAHRMLGPRAVGVIADSPSLARTELHDATEFARGIGALVKVVETRELKDDRYRINAPDRCYWCKNSLFTVLRSVAAQSGIGTICYGYNLDDVSEYRPGHRAAVEFSVRSPLFEAGLGKPEIRAIARELGLRVAEKPAAPCLASRIPHGSPVTVEKLRRIERMEARLHALGFDVCRARFDGAEMSIEVESHRVAEALAPSVYTEVQALATELGVVAKINPAGFRSGRLTEMYHPARSLASQASSASTTDPQR